MFSAFRRRIAPTPAARPPAVSPPRRAMSMFLWRHVPIYRKNTEGKVWWLAKKLTKPSLPVRADHLIPTNGKITWQHAVILPSGRVKPFVGKYGHAFVEFWREKTEEYRRERDYGKARGIPPSRYCARCDEELHWLRRVRVNFSYEEVFTKRQVYRRVYDPGANHGRQDYDDDESDDEVDEEVDDETKGKGRLRGQWEDRYCCPKEECGVREARFELRHNVAKMEVLSGLTDKQWKPKGKKGREQSARARARLAETPFEDRGRPLHGSYASDKEAPYLNGTTHEEALEIAARKAEGRRKPSLLRLDWKHRMSE